MNLVGETKERKYYFHSLSDSNTKFLRFLNREYILLIYCGSQSFEDPAQLRSMVDYLLEGNLRYVVCVGEKAEVLEDLFDMQISKGNWEKIRGEAIGTIAEPDNPFRAIFDLTHISYPEKSIPENILMLFPEYNDVAKKYIEQLQKAITEENKES